MAFDIDGLIELVAKNKVELVNDFSNFYRYVIDDHLFRFHLYKKFFGGWELCEVEMLDDPDSRYVWRETYINDIPSNKLKELAKVLKDIFKERSVVNEAKIKQLKLDALQENKDRIDEASKNITLKLRRLKYGV
jgi:hypothetical protein